MIRSIPLLLLAATVLTLRLKNHQCDAYTPNVQSQHSHFADDNVAPACKWLQKDLNEEKQLTLNLATIYSLGKMPGQCDPQRISKEEREAFLRNADEVKSKVLLTKAALLDSTDLKRKQAAEQLGEFQDSFLKCLKSI